MGPCVRRDDVRWDFRFKFQTAQPLLSPVILRCALLRASKDDGPPVADSSFEAHSARPSGWRVDTCDRILPAHYARALPEISMPSRMRAQGRPGARCTRGPVCG